MHLNRGLLWRSRERNEKIKKLLTKLIDFLDFFRDLSRRATENDREKHFQKGQSYDNYGPMFFKSRGKLMEIVSLELE